MISVLVPVFNSQKYLRQCLNSILMQTYTDFELIIVNDGSIDQSQNIIDEFAEKDSRVRGLTKENEKSISKTRNYLLNQIKGDYFIFVDSDDVVDKNYLKILFDTMIKTKSDIVACGFKVVNIPLITKRGFGVKQVKSKEAIDKMLFAGKFYSLWNKLIKTEALKDTSFDESLNYGEDLFFFFNLLKSDLKFTFIKNHLYFYRVRPNSLSTSTFGNSKKKFLDRLIEISNEKEYQTLHDVIKVWIYATAKYYRYETRKTKKENKEYRVYLKELIKEYKPFYQNKKAHAIFKLAMQFFSMF